MIYADFGYYYGIWVGSAFSDENDYQHLAARASRYIDYITCGRAEKFACLDAIKQCCCALAEQYQMIESAQALVQNSLSTRVPGEAEVQSETVGPWSRSYRSGGDSAQAAEKAVQAQLDDLDRIARQYLAGTGLLYRGGRCC